ncbi:hypothetical protein [Streptomyces sp. NPDC005799]|uniref:hypothetical protein n=1 Tax=Streptomyces sp. NPDC005799 TaxID=3154678 RepID=UPI0033DA4EDD
MTTADLYAAWLTAGDRLQAIGAWLAGDGAWLPLLVVAAVVIAGIWWHRPRDDYRTRNDQASAAQAARRDLGEVQKPGTNHGLYLDCLAVYGDCEELDRLRNAIRDHQKGEQA